VKKMGFDFDIPIQPWPDWLWNILVVEGIGTYTSPHTVLIKSGISNLVSKPWGGR
jgi:hypothetical protein